ncbi:MAG TPA: hypothetical protein PLK12_08105 [Prolixibacteraceae bacterium]|nr:hypothetical protein [Prolixibacteraceae bacterium]
MKRKWITGIVVAMLIGCVEDPSADLSGVTLLEREHSGCQGWKSRSLSEADHEESFRIQADGDKSFRIDHLGAFFNCCLPEGIDVAIDTRADTLFLNEREKVPGNCKCICPYDLIVRIGNLDDGEYVLCYRKEETVIGSIRLFFHENMDEEFSVSELTD